VNSNLRVGDRNKNQTYYGNIMFKYNPHLTFALEFRRFLTNWKAQPSSMNRAIMLIWPSLTSSRR